MGPEKQPLPGHPRIGRWCFLTILGTQESETVGARPDLPITSFGRPHSNRESPETPAPDQDRKGHHNSRFLPQYADFLRSRFSSTPLPGCLSSLKLPTEISQDSCQLQICGWSEPPLGPYFHLFDARMRFPAFLRFCNPNQSLQKMKVS